MDQIIKKINIGYGIFNSKIRKKLTKSKINELNDMIGTSVWKLSEQGEKDRELWIIVFQQLIETKVKEILFNKNKFPSILCSFTKIQFFQLRRLQLDDNNIENVESLGFLCLDQLQYLSIARNNIVCINSFFIKSRFPSLYKILFQKNPIKNIQYLQRFSILHKCKENKKFQMCGQLMKQPAIQEDLSILAKIQIKRNQTISYLLFQSFLGIKQQKVIKIVPY